MRYASVCSGVEAASLAWGKLGWTPVFFAEVEPFPCAVLMQRFNATKPLHPLDPTEATDEKDRKMRESWLKQINKLPEGGSIPNLGDFTKIKGEDYVGAVDLLVGGTPCQDLSVAGKRAGFEGARSSLALDFVRLAYEARCQYFVWENVPGVFSSNRGRDFATLLSMFCGYTVDVPKDGWKSSGIVRNRRPDRYGLAWRVLDAQFTRVPGFPFAVPQRRRRVFLVGCLGDWQRAASILLEPDRLSWDTPPRIKTREILAGCAEDCTETASGMNFVCVQQNQIGEVRTGNVAGTIGTDSNASGRNAPLCFHGSQDPISNETNANAIGRNGGLENCICYDARGNGDGETANTITGDHNNRVTDYTQLVQNVGAALYNASLSGDVAVSVTTGSGAAGHSGPSVIQNVSPTLDSSMFVKNQTQDAAKYAAIAIAENVIGRKVENGGNGIGAQDELAYTQNATGVMAVCTNLNSTEEIDYGNAEKNRPSETLRVLRNALGEKTFSEWIGRHGSVSQEEILQSEMYGSGVRCEAEQDKGDKHLPLSCEETCPARQMRNLWKGECPGRASQGRRLHEQQPIESDADMQELSHQGTSPAEALCNMWQTIQGAWLLHEAFREIQEVRQSASVQAESVRYNPCRTVRRLTPLEAEALMGFPDNHTRISWNGKPADECPDAPRYKACGNSMCVNCMEWIGRRIEQYS